MYKYPKTADIIHHYKSYKLRMYKELPPKWGPLPVSLAVTMSPDEQDEVATLYSSSANEEHLMHLSLWVGRWR